MRRLYTPHSDCAESTSTMKYKPHTGPQVEIAMTEEVGRLRGGVTKEGSDRAAKIYTFEKEVLVSSSLLLLSSLELSVTKVYEPRIRALIGTASHFWKEVPSHSVECACFFGAGCRGGT